MLVLPLPVGPVTRTMPHGLRMLASKRHSDSGSKPSLVMSSMRWALSSSRRAIFSPNSVGRHETRRSIVLAAPRILIRPSCGNRFSAMSSFAMTLKRDVIASRSRIGGVMTWWSTPSIRKRTRNCLS